LFQDGPRVTVQNLRAAVLFQPISLRTENLQSDVNKTRAGQFTAMWVPRRHSHRARFVEPALLMLTP
jgi:hypothetical protein